MRFNRYIIPFLALATIIISCEKIQSYPPEPKISLSGVDVKEAVDDLNNKNKVVILKFNFVDGDGDLMVSANYSDTTTNAKGYIQYYFRYHNTVTFQQDTIFFYKLYQWYMDRTNAQNKTQQGVITYGKPIYSQIETYDTVNIRAFVYDAKNHKSNTLEINDIPINKVSN